MAAHGEVNNRHPLVFEFFFSAILHVQSHDLGISLFEPLLVHVEHARYYIRIVGVDRLDLLVFVDADAVGHGEARLGVHGDDAVEKKIGLQWNRRRLGQARMEKRGEV